METTDYDFDTADIENLAQAIGMVFTELPETHRIALIVLLFTELRNIYGDDLEEAAASAKYTERRANDQRDRGYGITTMDQLSELHFKRMFRLSRHAFNTLLEKVQDLLEGDEVHACYSSGSPITPKTKLAVALRWLAGGSYLDICFEFGIGYGTFYQDGGVLWGTLEVLNEALNIGFPFDDKSELNNIEEGFSRYSHGHLRNCTLAIDGWVCRTRKPQKHEVSDPLAYRNRHDCWGIVVLAGCDSNLRFRMFSAISSGSTNDVLAWDCCEMKKLLEEGALPHPFYWIGDEAFINTAQFLVPWSGRGLEVWKDSFNYHLSAMRQCIECAFGLLVERWGIFWRPLRCDFRRWTLVCIVAAKLHNYCIDMNEGTGNDIEMRLERDFQPGDDATVYFNINTADDLETQAVRPLGETRRQLTRALQEEGVLRPQHAAANTRA